MNKYVVISSNDNPDYYQYVPFVIKAWNQLGWKVITFLRGDKKLLNKLIDGENIFYFLDGKSKYRDETLVQVSRLFGGCLIENGLIMTADGDMMPCSDYWKPNENEVTCYGHDLTGYGHYPICYISMSAIKWRDVMECKSGDNVLNEIESLLDKYPQAASEDWYEWWQVDQDIITEKLKKETVNSILRGGDNRFGLAKGRIDRFNWAETLNVENPIDAHMPRPFDIEAANNILIKTIHDSHIN